jgi:nitrate reductase gamma subunit
MSSQIPSSLPPIVQPPDRKQLGSEPDKNPLFHSRALILGVLFGVLAVLGLPLLWYSPAFSRNEKWFWSMAIVFYTLVLGLIAVAAVMFALRTVSVLGLNVISLNP